MNSQSIPNLQVVGDFPLPHSLPHYTPLQGVSQNQTKVGQFDTRDLDPGEYFVAGSVPTLGKAVQVTIEVYEDEEDNVVIHLFQAGIEDVNFIHLSREEFNFVLTAAEKLDDWRKQ